MCRSIMTLRAIEHDEGDVEAAALQFVRKISGYRKPARVNQDVFDAAVSEIAATSRHLLQHLKSPPRRTPATAPLSSVG
jgi:hypothetical protein